MESEQTPAEETPSSRFGDLHKVTPLSKYLAMFLFVALPFIGGWIGYTYAPEKVVEIERVLRLRARVNLKTKLEHLLRLNRPVSLNWMK